MVAPMVVKKWHICGSGSGEFASIALSHWSGHYYLYTYIKVEKDYRWENTNALMNVMGIRYEREEILTVLTLTVTCDYKIKAMVSYRSGVFDK